MRAAFEDLARNFDLGETGIVTVLLAPAARILRNAARFGCVGFVLGRPPIGRPFPDVADHVVDAITVRRKRHYRRGAVEAVLAFVLVREISLPGIGAMLSAKRELVAPSVFGTVEPAASGKLPLRFSRQVLAGPFGKSEGIGISNVHDRVIVQAVDVAFWSVRMPP